MEQKKEHLTTRSRVLIGVVILAWAIQVWSWIQ